MKRNFGLLLFVVGAAELVLTIAAFVTIGMKISLVISLIIGVILMGVGFMLRNQPEQQYNEQELEQYKQKGSISQRLGKL